MSPTYDKRQLLKSAYNYAQSGSWDRALEEYRRITKLFPDDPNVHSMVADLLSKKNDAAGAATEHLEAARLHKEQGADDKELAALRKALRVQPGHSEALERSESFFTRNIAKATQLMASEDLKTSEDLLQKLLDADPGHLQVNRLIDEIRTKKLQNEAMQAMAEEERIAVASAPMVDTAKEVLDRLGQTADAYLKAEDFDNAIDTLLIMLKIDPSRLDIRGRLDQAQEQLKRKQQAQSVWQTILANDAGRLEETKEKEISAKELAEWAGQEQAVRERLARELEAAEEMAHRELEVIERAVNEIRGRSGGITPVGREISADDVTRLKGLEQEKAQLEEKLLLERQAAVERERQIQEQVRRESEMLHHAIEMEKLEVEAKAKEAALKELEAKLKAEREAQSAQLEEERRRSQAAEEALRTQLQDLMREEMAKLRNEMQANAVAELQSKLEKEQEKRKGMEEDVRRREGEATSHYQEEQRKIEDFKRAVEDKVRMEREAIESLKSKAETRKQAIVEEAMKRRNVRTGTVTNVEEKQKILQSSRRISDVLHAATTKHLEQDVEGMLETAGRYLRQDLLLDAMRLCQKIAAIDPQNEKVKALLKEIYVRKGL